MIALGRSTMVGALAVWLAVVGNAPAEPPSEIVRADWYFRESLGPIADWETILARLEGSVPAEELTATLPVPIGGQGVEWPNPIPLLLLPVEDRNKNVRLRLVGDKAAVERSPDGDAEGDRTVTPGDTVTGYKHPGGGGKDQWYHAYHRRFDRLTTFAPFPAQFGIKMVSPSDFRRGANELTVELSSVIDEPIELDLQLEFHLPEATDTCGKQPVKLSGRATQSVRFPVHLDRPGGGLLMLKVTGPDRVFRIPLFTHVENVARVLDGIELILSDRPDAKASKRLALLRTRAEQWSASSESSPADNWRSLFEEASRLRDQLLLERIDFDTLIFVKRKPYFSEQPFMDAHHLFNRPGGGIYRLSPVRPDGNVTPVVDNLGEGVYRDVCLHWNAERFLFAFGNGSDKWDGSQSYDIYEAPIDGSNPRRLTSGPRNDCEAFYMADGKIGFTSDRSDFFVMCGGNRHAPTLFVMEADGSHPRQLSFNVFNDFNPTMLPDGRILYSRWEYNERSVTSLHNPFTMNPDGTMVSPYYGNATIRPNVVMFPRPVPNSRQVMALFTAHHGQTHGAIGLIDVRRGIDGPKPLTVLTPDVPITGEKAEDSRVGWYSDPVPLSESTYLCSYTPTVLPWLERSWALYVGDRHGNLALVYRDPEISCAEPVPLVARKQPHVRGSAPADTDSLVVRSQAGHVRRLRRSAGRRTWGGPLPAHSGGRAPQGRHDRRCDRHLGHTDIHRQTDPGHRPDRARRLGPFCGPGQPQRLLRGARRRPPGNPAHAKRGMPQAGRNEGVHRMPRTSHHGSARRRAGRVRPRSRPAGSTALGNASDQFPARRAAGAQRPLRRVPYSQSAGQPGDSHGRSDRPVQRGLRRVAALFERGHIQPLGPSGRRARPAAVYIRLPRLATQSCCWTPATMASS